jgi:hypothetical protein
MKLLMSLILVLVVVGMAAANAQSPGRSPRQPANTALLSSGLQGWQGRVGRMLLGLVNWTYWWVEPKNLAAPQKSDVPVPPAPVCDVFCQLRPVRTIGQ